MGVHRFTPKMPTWPQPHAAARGFRIVARTEGGHAVCAMPCHDSAHVAEMGARALSWARELAGRDVPLHLTWERPMTLSELLKA